MAQPIGDLFVKLGFNVDDGKLKSFDESIRGVFSNILQIAGLAGGAYGFHELAKGAEQNAVSLRNLNTELGVNLKYAQGFAALWQTVNPLDAPNKGLEITAHMANYASNMKYGGGWELGVFGGTALDNTPEKMVARLRAGLPNALATFGGDTARISQLLQAITGSPDMMNVLKATEEQRAEAEKQRDLNDRQIQDTEKAAESISKLSIAWDNFINHAMATIAPSVTEALTDINNKGVSDAIGGWWDYGGDFDTSGKPSMIGKWLGYYEDKFLGNGQYQGSHKALGLRSHNPGNLQPGGIESVFKNDEEGLYQMARQLRKYGGYGYDTIDKIIDHWAPAKGKGNSIETNAKYKAAIEKYLGVSGSAKLNLNDPEMIANLMAPMIFREQGENPFSKSQLQNAANSTSPQVTNNNTFHVHGSGDPDHAAEVVSQRIIDVTYPTINKGPDF